MVLAGLGLQASHWAASLFGVLAAHRRLLLFHSKKKKKTRVLLRLRPPCQAAEARCSFTLQWLRSFFADLGAWRESEREDNERDFILLAPASRRRGWGVLWWRPPWMEIWSSRRAQCSLAGRRDAAWGRWSWGWRSFLGAHLGRGWLEGRDRAGAGAGAGGCWPTAERRHAACWSWAAEAMDPVEWWDGAAEGRWRVVG
jgi:hypothetical protein